MVDSGSERRQWDRRGDSEMHGGVVFLNIGFGNVDPAETGFCLATQLVMRLI